MFCIMNQLVYYAVSYSELARHYITDLCGLMRAKNSFVLPFLRLSVLSSYALRVVTGHNRDLVGKVGKNKLGNRLALPRLFSKATW